jgi:hypothetical protein
VTPGTANANSSLVLNADKEITGIVLLSSTTLGGTLSTAAQPNITSVGSLSGLTTAGIILGATTITATGSEINKLAGVTATTSEINKLAGVTAGTVTASKALIVDANKDLSSLRNLTIGGTLGGVTTLTATTVDGTLSTAAQPNITSVGSLSGLTTVGITLGSTAITATGNEINKLAGVTASTSEINTLAGVTAGTVAVSKALVVDSNKDLASLRNLTATGTVSANTLTGTLSTASQPNITSVGSLSGLTTAGITLGATAITATGTEINILDGVTASTSEINTLAGVTVSTSEINTLAGVTAGTVAVSKALVVDSNKDLASLRNLTATGTVSANALTGTLSTAAQPNITSVGSLSGLTTAGITLGATAITATGTEINILDGVTASTSEINILDGVTASTLEINILAGVTATASEINILDGVTATAAEINILDGVTTTSSEINTLAGVTAGTVTASKALVVDSNKDLTSLRNLTLTGTVSANTLAGSLSTAAQNAITSVGTLTSLTLSGAVSGVTTLGLSGIATSTNATASTSNTTGALKLAGGIGISDATDATSNTNGGTFTSAGGGAFAKSLYVGTNLTVGGNLTISGTTSTVNSSVVNINDNMIVLNSGPSGTGFDSGFNSQRYQISNGAGTGDVVNDTAKATATLAATASGTTLTLPTSLSTGTTSAVNDFYNNWWVKVTSGSGNNQVRKIVSYVGSTRVTTLDSTLTTSLAISDTISLYNKPFTSMVWQEANKRFVTAFAASDVTGGALSIIDYADIASNNQTLLSTTTSTSNSTGALKIAGGIGISNTTDAISTTNGGTFTSAGGAAIAKKLFVGERITTTAFGAGFSHNDGVINLTSFVDNRSWSEAYFGTSTNHPLYLQTNNFTQLIIETGGSVNILSHNGSTTGLKLSGTLVTSTAAELNYVDVTPGTAAASKALVLDASSNIASGLNSLTATSLVTTNFSLGGTSVTSTAAQLNFLSGVTAGTAAASKALVLDSSSNITGINNLSMGGTLTVGTSGSADNLIKFKGVTGDSPDNFTVISERLYNGSDNAELLLFKGNDIEDRVRIRAGNLAFQTTGAAEIFSTLADSNTRLYIQNSGKVSVGSNCVSNDTIFGVLDGTNGSTSVSMRFGNNLSTNNCMTMTWNPIGGAGSGSNYLSFNPYGIANTLVVQCNGRVGIGTSAPGFPFDVDAFVSNVSVGANWGYDSDGPNSNGSGGTVNVAVKINNNVVVNGIIFVTSDKRLKQNFMELEKDYCKRFIFETTPTQFEYKSNIGKICNGYVAQEVYKAGFKNLIDSIPYDSLEEDIDSDGFRSAENEKMILSYEGIIPILAKNIKNLYEDNEKLENKVKDLEEKNKTLEDRLKILEDMILNT